MPTLREKIDGQYFIRHALASHASDDDEGGSIRTFTVASDAAELLERSGYQDGSILPRNLFNWLLDQNLVWPGQQPRFHPA